MINEKIAVVGGDLRNLEAAKALADKGFKVSVFGIDLHDGDFGNAECAKNLSDALACAKLLILPIPYCREDKCLNAPLCTKKIELDEIFSLLSSETVVAAGMAQGIPCCFKVYDYLKDETFATLNACPTVEGALAVAIRETDITISGSNTLVLGYGRVAGLLADALKSLGAHVTVFARKPVDIAKCEAKGLSCLPFDRLTSSLVNAEIVFNTVPAQILTFEVLANANRNAVIIDLASSPGGVERRAVDITGIKLISALGLPGRFSPKTAGEIIARCAVKTLI